MKNRKIVILGAGHVGTHCALSLMFRALANEIVLIDTDEEKAKSQVLDLDDMGACIPAKVVIRSGNYDDLCDADILVNAIGRYHSKDQKHKVSRNFDQYHKSCRCCWGMFKKGIGN